MKTLFTVLFTIAALLSLAQRTELTVEASNRIAALEPTANAVDSVTGNSFDNASHAVILYVVNASGDSINCTVLIPGDFEGQAIPDVNHGIPDGDRRVIGPFNSTYDQEDPDNSIMRAVFFDWDRSTGVTCEVIRVQL